MKRIFLSVAALLTVSVVAAQTADEVNTKFNEAATLLTAKNAVGAIPVLEETIEMAKASTDDVSTTLTEAQKHLANSYIAVGAGLAKTGKFDEALADLEKGRNLAKEISDIRNKMKAETMISTIYTIQGAAKLKAEDFAAAADLYDKAVAVNPKNTKNLLTAAQVFAKAGDLEKAGGYYESVIKLGSSHSKYKADADKAKAAYTNDLMNIAASAKDFETAEGAINKVLAFDEASPVALSTLVKIANNFKKYDVVTANADKALAAQTDATEKSNLSFLVGAAYEISGNTAKAIASYKQVVSGDNAAAAKAQIEALSK